MCCYARGCRCDKCKTYNSQKNARYVAKRRQREPTWRPEGARVLVSASSVAKLCAALKDHDIATVRALLLADSVVNETGCWLWARLNGSGYPTAGKGGGALHRHVLEAKFGAPLGVQQAHHVCANRTCVNPDHLQPVTHQQNTAEMKQRNTYLARIRELERALANISPNHPVLNTVPVL